MKSCTFGVEEEFIVVDSTNLMPAQFDFNRCQYDAGFKNKFISREMHHGVLETKTPVCTSLGELAEKISAMRDLAKGCVELQGLRLMASGTHPMANWQQVPMVNEDVYADVINEYQDVARSNYIFGLHLHVGFWDPSLAIPVANVMREHLPLLLALSANSPFWNGRNTGVRSFRHRIFRKMPRSGLPPVFENIREYDEYLQWLLATGSIKKPTSIWWDIRVHPIYKTVEIRIMDQQTTRQDAIAMAVFVAGLTTQMANRVWKGELFNLSDGKKIEENLWRASRYGLDAKLIDLQHQTFCDAREMANEKLHQLQEIIIRQGAESFIDYISHLIQSSGSEKQLMVHDNLQSTHSLLNSLLLSEQPSRIIRVE